MANELRFLDGDLLFVDDKLAMSEDCCCDTDPGVGYECSNGNDFIFPSQVTVDFDTGYSNHAGFGVCTGNNCNTFGGVQTIPMLGTPSLLGPFLDAWYELSIPNGDCSNTLRYRFRIRVTCNLSDSADLFAAVSGTATGSGAGVENTFFYSGFLPNRLDWRGFLETLVSDAKNLCTTGPSAVVAEGV